MGDVHSETQCRKLELVFTSVFAVTQRQKLVVGSRRSSITFASTETQCGRRCYNTYIVVGR